MRQYNKNKWFQIFKQKRVQEPYIKTKDRGCLSRINICKKKKAGVMDLGGNEYKKFDIY